jgi:TRAP-type C4-dicarboxylate transport system permease small subunit
MFFTVAGLFFSGVGFFLLSVAENSFKSNGNAGISLLSPEVQVLVTIAAPLSLIIFGLGLISGGFYYYSKHRSIKRPSTGKGNL